MKVLRSGRVIWPLGITLLILSGLYVHSVWFRPHLENRVYRIGWQEVPPFQQKAEDGSPAGLAIDFVRSAAERSGIRLEWVFYPGSSETALRNHDVDLWPLITITPARLKTIHISEPYLRHDHNLLVLASSKFHQPEDLASASIGHLDQFVVRQMVGNLFPRARLVVAESQRAVMENMCAGRTDAVFLDDFTSGTVLLSGFSCPLQSLRVIPLPTLRSTLGVGSTKEASVVADEIRREIDEVALTGQLARILKNQGYYSPRDIDYVTAQLNAHRRERALIFTAAAFAGLSLLLIIAVDRIRRQRNRIRASQQALWKNEQKLRLLANNLSETVLAYDMDRRLVFANPAFEKLTGYSVADLEQDKPLFWVHPDDYLRIHELWNSLYSGETFSNAEYRLVTIDGRTRWMTATWCPVFDEPGQQVGVQGSERDITESKLAEEALRESERRFRELLENVQLVAVITDRNGSIIFCNDYALTLTGWNREEIIGTPAREFIDDGLPLGAVAPDAAFEGTLLEKAGGRRCIQWSTTPLRDPGGRASGFASLGVDVTELKALRTRAAQLESEERFRKTADTSPLMIWVADSDCACTFVNKGWLAFTGRALEEELGNGWTSNVHPDDLSSCLAAFRDAFQSRRDFQMEYRKRRADGQYRWVLATGVARFGINGEFAGYVGTCTDITGLKQSRDEEFTRQKLENVGRLATGLAHDFNNLLGVVLAQSDLALAGLAAGESVGQTLKNIREAAIRGSLVIQQLIIYAGQESVASDHIDLSALIEGMLELLKLAVSGNAILETELGHNLPLIHANPAQLRQLVLSLVTNASEAIGDKHGIIRVSTTVANLSPDASHNGSNRFVQLEVSDSGRGIDPDTQSKLFDPFFTTKSVGKGLGLPVVQRIVQALDGTIQFETEPGRGTTFRILLPSTAEAVSPSPRCTVELPAGNNAPTPGLTLVVEDEEHLRAAVVRMLRRSSIPVIEAGNGTAALNLLREHRQRVGVVILDIAFAGASSHDVFTEIRRLCPDAKVIVSTAHGRQKADEAFPEMNIDAFLQKPYRLADLVATVNGFLCLPHQQ